VSVRDVQLAEGERLVVREATPDDVPAVCALFERLSPDDRQRRFFSAFHPDDGFVHRLVTRSPEEGAVLLAEVEDADGRHVVAEAEYARTDDGDGELAITVDRSWRGWLAPFLLDALLEVAAGRDVANLRAEVLVRNRPMLALLRARGYAALDTGDASVVEAVVSTRGGVPSWPPVRRHPRVLVEVPGAHWRLAGALRRAGVDVIGCPGPSRQARGCPLLRGERCPLVEGADLVVHAIGPEDELGAALLDALPGAARRLVVDVSQARPAPAVPAGATAIDHPTEEEVRELVRSLLALPVDPTPQPERAET